MKRKSAGEAKHTKEPMLTDQGDDDRRRSRNVAVVRMERRVALPAALQKATCLCRCRGGSRVDVARGSGGLITSQTLDVAPPLALTSSSAEPTISCVCHRVDGGRTDLLNSAATVLSVGISWLPPPRWEQIESQQTATYLKTTREEGQDCAALISSRRRWPGHAAAAAVHREVLDYWFDVVRSVERDRRLSRDVLELGFVASYLIPVFDAYRHPDHSSVDDDDDGRHGGDHHASITPSARIVVITLALHVAASVAAFACGTDAKRRLWGPATRGEDDDDSGVAGKTVMASRGDGGQQTEGTIGRRPSAAIASAIHIIIASSTEREESSTAAVFYLGQVATAAAPSKARSACGDESTFSREVSAFWQACRLVGNLCYGMDDSTPTMAKQVLAPRLIAPLTLAVRRATDIILQGLLEPTAGDSGRQAGRCAALGPHQSAIRTLRWSSHALSSLVYGRAPNAMQALAAASASAAALSMALRVLMRVIRIEGEARRSTTPVTGTEDGALGVSSCCQAPLGELLATISVVCESYGNVVFRTPVFRRPSSDAGHDPAAGGAGGHEDVRHRAVAERDDDETPASSAPITIGLLFTDVIRLVADVAASRRAAPSRTTAGSSIRVCEKIVNESARPSHTEKKQPHSSTGTARPNFPPGLPDPRAVPDELLCVVARNAVFALAAAGVPCSLPPDTGREPASVLAALAQWRGATVLGTPDTPVSIDNGKALGSFAEDAKLRRWLLQIQKTSSVAAASNARE